MLLITTFVELRMVAGRSRTRAGRPHAVSGRPMLIHTCHAMPMPRCAVVLKSRFQNSMVVAWHERGMVCVNQTRPHFVYNMGKTKSKLLAARHGHGMGTAWYCELALSFTRNIACCLVPEIHCCFFPNFSTQSTADPLMIISLPQLCACIAFRCDPMNSTDCTVVWIYPKQ
jgi:hypothetical protein